LPLRDDLQRLPLRRLQFGQRRDAFVERGEHATPAKGETEQIRIGHLLVADQPRPGEDDGLGEWQVIRPKGVV